MEGDPNSVLNALKSAASYNTDPTTTFLANMPASFLKNDGLASKTGNLHVIIFADGVIACDKLICAHTLIFMKFTGTKLNVGDSELPFSLAAQQESTWNVLGGNPQDPKKMNLGDNLIKWGGCSDKTVKFAASGMEKAFRAQYKIKVNIRGV